MNSFYSIKKSFIQTLYLLIIINYFTTDSFAKINEKKLISNYFSGIVSSNNNNYDVSLNFLKKLDGLELEHSKFANIYMKSLINNSKLNEAFKFAKRLEKNNINSFESDLIIAIHHFKNAKYDDANNYFSKLLYDHKKSPLEKLIAETLYFWSKVELSNFEDSKTSFSNIDDRFKNIKKIQLTFLNCYYEKKNTDFIYNELINETNVDFSRYNYFYINYLYKNKNFNKAKIVLEKSLNQSPRNLLLNQTKLDIINKRKNIVTNQFDCKNIKDIYAELFYLIANAFSTQSLYDLSNYYLSFAKYLNPNFPSFEILLAENFYMDDKVKKALLSYKKIKDYGEIYDWHASKQTAIILINKKNNLKKGIDIMSHSFKKLSNPNVYQIYDYANFLKNNEEFKDSIKLYTEVLNSIDKRHQLYPKATDGRGIANERLGNWKIAEKDFLQSLEVSPDQAYVINYLAYSWIEKGINIEKSLKMLKKANELKPNDGYITDSLGWALYKLKKFSEAKKYLQLAVKLMPSDPIVNDHYADALWMLNQNLQARYHWEYVLNLKETDEKLRLKINDKLLFGPNFQTR